MANSKKKGNRGENKLAKMLCERFGEGSFKRTPSSGAYTGGKNREKAEYLPWEAKIVLASDIITPSNFNFIIEHKFYQEVNFWNLFSESSQWLDWIEQAKSDADFVGKEPMVIIKYNRHDRLVILDSIYLEEKLRNFDLSMRPMLVWAPKGKNVEYSIVFLKDLLELPNDFWFSGEAE